MRPNNSRFNSLKHRRLQLQRLEDRQLLDASAVLDDVVWIIEAEDDPPLIAAEDVEAKVTDGGSLQGNAQKDENPPDDIMIYGAVTDPEAAAQENVLQEPDAVDLFDASVEAVVVDFEFDGEVYGNKKFAEEIEFVVEELYVRSLKTPLNEGPNELLDGFDQGKNLYASDWDYYFAAEFEQPNKSLLTATEGGDGDALGDERLGPPQPLDTDCWEPVCGVDGHSYRSAQSKATINNAVPDNVRARTEVAPGSTVIPFASSMDRVIQEGEDESDVDTEYLDDPLFDWDDWLEDLI